MAYGKCGIMYNISIILGYSIQNETALPYIKRKICLSIIQQTLRKNIINKKNAALFCIAHPNIHVFATSILMHLLVTSVVYLLYNIVGNGLCVF